MQSLDIKRPAERSSRVVASAILIDCPAVAAATTTILSGYFVPAVSTNCCLCCSKSVLLLDLFYCWICWICYAAQLFRPTCSVLLFLPTVLLLLLLLLLLLSRSVPLFRLFYRYCSDRLSLTNCYRLTATDRPVTECSAIKSSTARCPTAY